MLRMVYSANLLLPYWIRKLTECKLKSQHILSKVFNWRKPRGNNNYMSTHVFYHRGCSWNGSSTWVTPSPYRRVLRWLSCGRCWSGWSSIPLLDWSAPSEAGGNYIHSACCLALRWGSSLALSWALFWTLWAASGSTCTRPHFSGCLGPARSRNLWGLGLSIGSFEPLHGTASSSAGRHCFGPEGRGAGFERPSACFAPWTSSIFCWGQGEPSQWWLLRWLTCFWTEWSWQPGQLFLGSRRRQPRFSRWELTCSRCSWGCFTYSIFEDFGGWVCFFCQVPSYLDRTRGHLRRDRQLHPKSFGWHPSRPIRAR